MNDLVFVGLKSRVAALRRDTGEMVWSWRAPKPRGGSYLSLLVIDKTRLIASVDGYTYCLDARTGAELWFNELKGFGTGVASIATLGAHHPHDAVLLAAAADAANAAAASAGGAGS